MKLIDDLKIFHKIIFNKHFALGSHPGPINRTLNVCENNESNFFSFCSVVTVSSSPPSTHTLLSFFFLTDPTVWLLFCVSLARFFTFCTASTTESNNNFYCNIYDVWKENKMASKRKSEPVKKTAKRGKKKTDDSFDSDLSDDYGDEVAGNGNGNNAPVTFDERAVLPKLPEELLASRDREPGQLVMAGMVTWDIVGKRADTKGGVKIRPNLWNFHRFGEDKYRRVVSGCASAHSILVSMDRKALTFGKLHFSTWLPYRSFPYFTSGRNNFAQLGQPELKTYEKPTLVPGLEGFNIIDAACGRNHTLFLTDTGLVYSCGDNKSGQCGVGTSTAMITKVTRINYTGAPIIKVGCGAEFSVILDVKGNLHTFGLPEYGQLGHNTDGEHCKVNKTNRT